MNISSWHSIFFVLIVVGAILTLIGTIGYRWTGRKIDREREAKILSLQHDLNAVQPRHLSPRQKEQLVSKLSTKKAKVGFVSRLMDGESANFADELTETFRSAGWEVVPTIRTSLNELPGYLTIFVTGDNLKETADFISQSLREINIDCHPKNINEGSISGVRDLGIVYVVVGRKE